MLLRRLPGFFLCALVVGLAAAACGEGDDSSSITPTPAPSPEATATAPTVTPPSGRDVQPEDPLTVVDLATDPALLTIVGAELDDVQTGGSSVASGDFNGDGVADVLLGASFGDGPDDSRENAGEAYVIFGPTPEEDEINLAAEGADLTIYGALPGDNAGFSVIAGDLNADGIDDVVVGAPGSNALANLRTDMGEAYVVFGSPSLGGTVDLAEVEQDFTFRPAEGFTRVGTSFAVGDVNGDGVDDLIAGGPFGGRVEGTPPGSPRTTEGEAYVVFGSPTLSGEVDVRRGEESIRFKGAEENDKFGQAVASGDVNGDGVDDVIVTAKGADGPENSRIDGGEAYVFFGSSRLAGLVMSDEADLTVYAAEERDTLGDVAASADVNGDGVADIVLSARFADGPANVRATGGETYVIFGSPSLGGETDLAEEVPDAVVYGRDGTDSMPTAVVAADLDGDGREELAIGAAFTAGAENARARGGEAYVIPGSALSGEVDLRTDVGGVAFVYGMAEDQVGIAAGWLDFDGDGRLELLLLAPGSLGIATEPGRLYLVEIPAP